MSETGLTDREEALAWLAWFMDEYDLSDEIRTLWGVSDSQCWPILPDHPGVPYKFIALSPMMVSYDGVHFYEEPRLP